MTKEDIEYEVNTALAGVVHRAFHRSMTPPVRAPLPTEFRLSTRLAIVAAIQTWELTFLKETMADHEAIEAAKAYFAQEKP